MGVDGVNNWEAGWKYRRESIWGVRMREVEKMDEELNYEICGKK